LVPEKQKMEEELEWWKNWYNEIQDPDEAEKELEEKKKECKDYWDKLMLCEKWHKEQKKKMGEMKATNEVLELKIKAMEVANTEHEEQIAIMSMTMKLVNKLIVGMTPANAEAAADAKEMTADIMKQLEEILTVHRV